MSEENKSEIYVVKGIYEDDFGCEERAAEAEKMVLVKLQDRSGSTRMIRQSDAWMYQQEVAEGDEVFLIEHVLKKRP